MSATPLVLGHRDGAAGGLGDVWHEVDSLAWLPLAPRIVVQVGGGGDRALATETARSLVEFLETRRVADVEIVDADRVPAASWRVGCVTSPGELVVPADWFESHALVTIAAAHRARPRVSRPGSTSRPRRSATSGIRTPRAISSTRPIGSRRPTWSSSVDARTSASPTRRRGGRSAPTPSRSTQPSGGGGWRARRASLASRARPPPDAACSRGPPRFAA
jgi:hypothetical protein